MIRAEELVEIGRFGQPHGIKGELNATVDVDVATLRCIVVSIDGIFVPFFTLSFRSRGQHAILLTIDGVTSEESAAHFQGKSIYALKTDCPDGVDDDSNADGFYAEDLIGYRIIDETGALDAEITEVDDSTDNVLFVTENDSGCRFLIPVADEFITDIDTAGRIITVDLPEGLLDI